MLREGTLCAVHTWQRGIAAEAVDGVVPRGVCTRSRLQALDERSSVCTRRSTQVRARTHSVSNLHRAQSMLRLAAHQRIQIPALLHCAVGCNAMSGHWPRPLSSAAPFCLSCLPSSLFCSALCHLLPLFLPKLRRSLSPLLLSAPNSATKLGNQTRQPNSATKLGNQAPSPYFSFPLARLLLQSSSSSHSLSVWPIKHSTVVNPTEARAC